MTLGEKLFEEIGQVTHFRITKVHPMEGTTMEVSFTSEIKGAGKFPNGKNIGSGVVTQYPHGIIDGNYQGKLITVNGAQIVWWAHEKGRVVADAANIGNSTKIKSLIMVSAFTNSQDLSSWINNLIIVLEAERDLATHHSKALAYEWK